MTTLRHLPATVRCGGLGLLKTPPVSLADKSIITTSVTGFASGDPADGGWSVNET